MKERFGFYFLWLSLVCIVMFIFQNIFSGFTDLFILNLKAVYEFQIWRFVSSIFLHGGVVHLLYNLFALLLFGFILERKLGSIRFLLVFFASGILANIIAVNFYPSSLGASGAIYGILGCLAVIAPMMIVWAFGLLMPMFIAAILWVLGGVLGVFGFGSGDVGYIAHLSGIFVGIALGIFFRIKHGKTEPSPDKIKIPDNYVRDWEETYLK